MWMLRESHLFFLDLQPKSDFFLSLQWCRSLVELQGEALGSHLLRSWTPGLSPHHSSGQVCDCLLVLWLVACLVMSW